MRDEPLRYSFAPGRTGDTTILKLIGSLTLTSMFGLQDELRAATRQILIIDLSETPYMDSAGLGLLMNYYVSAQNHGRRLLLAGMNDRISSLLEMTKVKEILTCFPSVGEAESSL